MKKRIAALAFMALSACSFVAKVGPEEAALCGPPPTADQARTAVQEWVELRDLNDQQVRNIRVENCVRYWQGIVNGGGYAFGWQIAFEHNFKTAIAGEAGFSPITIIIKPAAK